MAEKTQFRLDKLSDSIDTNTQSIEKLVTAVANVQAHQNKQAEQQALL